MKKDTNHTTTPEAHHEVPRQRSDWKAFLDRVSYAAIVRNVPYMAFVVLLCVVYISNNKKAVDTQRELNALNDTLKELRWEYLDAKSQMMYAQMEIEVIRNAADIGLKPMLRPAFKIKKETLSAKEQPE